MNRLALAVLFLLAPLYLHAASFDCAKARTPSEKAICASPKLSADDEKLAQAYHSVLANYPQAAKLISQSQRDWLRQAEASCNLDANKNSSVSLADCLDGEWQDRIRFLSRIVVKKAGVLFFFHQVRLKIPAANRTHMNTGDATNQTPQIANTFRATWPQALSNAPKWQAWNKALLDEAHRYFASQDTNQTIPNHWVLVPTPSWNSDVEVDVNLGSVSSTLVTTTITEDYIYAHPARNERAFNWLLKQQRELRPDDLFRADSGWQAWIMNRMAEIVWKNQSPRKSDADAIADTKSLAKSAGEDAIQPRHWRITHQGIRIIFSQAELGYLPAVYMPPTTFPWSELKPYLNPHFQIPR